jgi:hypothetical protein
VPSGSHIDSISLALRQGLYNHSAALYSLYYQLIAIEQGHTNKRVDVGFIHGNATRFTISNDYRLIDIEKAFAPVCQQRTSPPTPHQAKCGDQRGRQRQDAVKTRVDHSVDFLLLPLRATHRQADDGWLGGKRSRHR